jgi:hypothetical protein
VPLSLGCILMAVHSAWYLWTDFALCLISPSCCVISIISVTYASMLA